ncbi:MAG TPA: hypothetical protein P5307_29435 [Pirellulaceae bacterium]|nr:hypothetical protein [Pirellulaceae bacterium]
MPRYYTTGELADFIGSEEWRVRRLFETSRLPEPERFGGKRAIPRELIPEVIDALRERGWLELPTPIAEA